MGSERGYTLIEALIVVFLLIVVLGATLSLLDNTAKIVPQENERAHAVREAQVGLGFMVRELRQAHSVDSYSANSIIVRTPVQGVVTKVAYDCSQPSISKPGLNACRRRQYAADTTTVVATTHPVDRLVTDHVFQYTLDAGEVSFVKARIEVPASGERDQGLEHTIVLDDGLFLRNVTDG